MKSIFQTIEAVANCQSMQPPTMTTTWYKYVGMKWPIGKVFPTDIIFRWYRQRYKIFQTVDTDCNSITVQYGILLMMKNIFQTIEAVCKLSINATATQWQLHDKYMSEWVADRKGIAPTDIIFRWYRQRYKIFQTVDSDCNGITAQRTHLEKDISGYWVCLQIVNQCNRPRNDNYMKIHVGMMADRKGIAPTDIIFRWYRQRYKIFQTVDSDCNRITDTYCLWKIFQTIESVANCQSMQPRSNDNYMKIHVGMSGRSKRYCSHRYHLSVVQTAVQDISDCWLWRQQYNSTVHLWKRYFRLLSLLQIVNQCNCDAMTTTWKYMSEWVADRKGILPQISFFGGTDSGTRYFRLLTLTATA